MTRKSPGLMVGPVRLFLGLRVFSGMRHRREAFSSVSPRRTLYHREDPADANSDLASGGNLYVGMRSRSYSTLAFAPTGTFKRYASSPGGVASRRSSGLSSRSSA